MLPVWNGLLYAEMTILATRDVSRTQISPAALHERTTEHNRRREPGTQYQHSERENELLLGKTDPDNVVPTRFDPVVVKINS